MPWVSYDNSLGTSTTQPQQINRQLECGCLVGSLRKDFNEQECPLLLLFLPFPPVLEWNCKHLHWETAGKSSFFIYWSLCCFSSVSCYHVLKLCPGLIPCHEGVLLQPCCCWDKVPKSLTFSPSAKPYLPFRLQYSFISHNCILPSPPCPSYGNIFHRLENSALIAPPGSCISCFKAACCRSSGPTKHSLVAVNGTLHCSSGSLLFPA